MGRFKFGAFALMATMSVSALADSPKAARDILASAMKQAKAEKKAIFVVFDASW